MSDRMYKERQANIPVFRGCAFGCIYCNFGRMLKLSSCPECRAFKPHAHMEALKRTPPRTKDGTFITVGLSSDVSFMNIYDMRRVLEYCGKYSDRTFLIQTKNPAYFKHVEPQIPENVIIGTTIESNRIWYGTLAPSTISRFTHIRDLNHNRKAVTIEPVMDFDMDVMEAWLTSINPELCWLGYDSTPEKHPLLEPGNDKVIELIERMRGHSIEIKPKMIREPVNDPAHRSPAHL